VNVVIDTNIIISTLVFNTGRLHWLKDAWSEQIITPLVDPACSEELLRALTYPKFKLSAEEIGILLEDYLPYTKVIKITEPQPGRTPKCRDPHDQKFLQLAYAGKVHALITGDKVLLELNNLTPFEIITAFDFRKRLQQALNDPDDPVLNWNDMKNGIRPDAKKT
jgi:putative PIN family toxin of toxin-antitoxin system